MRERVPGHIAIASPLSVERPRAVLVCDQWTELIILYIAVGPKSAEEIWDETRDETREFGSSIMRLHCG